MAIDMTSDVPLSKSRKFPFVHVIGHCNSQEIRSFLRIAALLACYIVLERSLMRLGNLPVESYAHPVLFVEFAKHLGITLILFLVAMVAVLLRFAGLSRGWRSMDDGQPIRVFVIVAVGILAWSYSTYDYNCYFDQGHMIDRLMLVVMVPLIWWRPAFVLPFLGLVVPVIWQCNHPLGLFLWAIDGMLVRLLILFVAAFALAGIRCERRLTDFIFLACCLIASHYWCPGYLKAKLNWLEHGSLDYMMLAAYANGWLVSLQPATILTAAKWLNAIEWPLRFLTLLLECGALFFIYRRSTMIAMLAGWVMFHCGVFLTIGYCFWKWVIVDGVLAFLLIRDRKSGRWPIFSRGRFVLSIVIIGTGSIWFRPANLAWYETRLFNVYKIEAMGADGNRYALPASFFGLYADQFTMAQFDFMSRDRMLVNPYGVTGNLPIAQATDLCRTPQEIASVKSKMGNIRFNGDRAARFNFFLKRYIDQTNKRGWRDSWLKRLQAPRFLWNVPHGTIYRGQEAIQAVTIYKETFLFDDIQVFGRCSARYEFFPVVLHKQLDGSEGVS